MSVRLAACCGLAALAIPASGHAQADTGNAVRNWTAITECGTISDAERRLACMDNVLRRAGIETAAASEQELPAQARSEAAAPPLSASAPVPSPAQPRRPQTATNREELTTTIASVRTLGYQKVLVTTSDGSTWEQTEAKSFLTPPKLGDAFSVEPAAMNSFRCRFNQSSRYRCRPVN